MGRSAMRIGNARSTVRGIKWCQNAWWPTKTARIFAIHIFTIRIDAIDHIIGQMIGNDWARLSLLGIWHGRRVRWLAKVMRWFLMVFTVVNEAAQERIVTQIQRCWLCCGRIRPNWDDRLHLQCCWLLEWLGLSWSLCQNCWCESIL